MKLTNPYQQYLNNKANTNKAELMIIVYDFAITNLKKAQTYIGTNEYQKKGNAIDNSFKAVSELIFSLDKSTDNNTVLNISNNLEKIYNFILRSISSANINNDKEILNSPIHILTDIKDTWLKVIDINRNESIL